MASIRDDHFEVDDFAVQPDQAWETEGRLLWETLAELGPLANSDRQG